MNKTTINDIARLAGVSKTSVSMVLNQKDANIGDDTRQKIIKISEELGYIPNYAAKSLNTNISGTMGIVLPDITNPFFAQMGRAIEDYASELQYNVILCNSDNDVEKEIKYIKLLISKQVDGVILISGGNELSGINILKSNHTPFVLVDRYITGYRDEMGVYCKNREGIIEGVDYLYLKGKRKIIFVNEESRLHVFKERLAGYIDAMKKYDIYNENYIFETKLSLQGGMNVTERILEQVKGIEAIFYCSDIMALGGMKILIRKKYRIPDDIAIMGFDNIQIDEFIEPELTTIEQPVLEMGKSACKILVDYINGKSQEREIFFTPKLKIRDTV